MKNDEKWDGELIFLFIFCEWAMEECWKKKKHKKVKKNAISYDKTQRAHIFGESPFFMLQSNA